MAWITGTTSATNTASSTMTWQCWNQAVYSTTASSTMTLTLLPAWGTWNAAYEESLEQRAERERLVAQRLADWQREQQERARIREQAHARAEELLLSLLTDEQAASRRERGWFEVRGSAGGRYRIRRSSQAGNVDLMPETGEEREASYCCHPSGGLPDADAHLAQMLALVTDEDRFLRTANVAYQRPEAALPVAA